MSEAAASRPLRSTTAPVAVVTGASAGVGRATAVELARRGFDVALLARGEAGLEGARHDVERLGRRALVLTVDVADADAVEQAATAAEEQLGPIDVWVNSAMTTVFAEFGDITPEEFERAVAVTFLGQVWGTRAALRRMKPRDRGAIVDVGSALAFVGIPLQAPYCAAKFACRGFFESVRAELHHEGSNVRMSMVHLPAVDTPQFGWCAARLDHEPMPVQPIYDPALAATAIVDAALDGRRSKVLGSWNKALVVAAQLLPGFASHFAARSAWEGQLTPHPVDPDRPFNLFEPADATEDHGIRGSFGAMSGGVADLAFLRQLPATAVAVVQAAFDSAREHAAVRARRRA
jgi:NAD(P)-dependent dehydrogenase (short-subunit alcohol dehydrogenase family)